MTYNRVLAIRRPFTPRKGEIALTHPLLKAQALRIWRYLALSLTILAVSACSSPFEHGLAHALVGLPAADNDAETWGVSFDGGDARILVGSLYQVDIWDWREKRKERTLQLPQGSDPMLLTRAMDLSESGQYLVVALANARGNVGARIWNTRDWSVALDLINEDGGYARAAAFTPNGQTLVYATPLANKSEIIGYQTGTWAKSWVIVLENFTVETIRIGPGAKSLAVEGTAYQAAPPEVIDPLERIRMGKQWHELRIVDLSKREVVSTVVTPTVGPLTWRPDATELLINADSAEEFLQVPSSKLVMVERPPSTAHITSAYSPDSRYLVEGDMNGKGTGMGIFLWDGRRTTLLQRMQGNVSSVAFSRDSRFLVSGATGSATVWQLK